MGGPAAGIHRDAKNDCSLFPGLSGFGGVNERGSFRKGGLRRRDIRGTASRSADSVCAGAWFSSWCSGQFLRFWEGWLWSGARRNGCWCRSGWGFRFRQNLWRLLQRRQLFGRGSWFWKRRGLRSGRIFCRRGGFFGILICKGHEFDFDARRFLIHQNTRRGGCLRPSKENRCMGGSDDACGKP